MLITTTIRNNKKGRILKSWIALLWLHTKNLKITDNQILRIGSVLRSPSIYSVSLYFLFRIQKSLPTLMLWQFMTRK